MSPKAYLLKSKFKTRKEKKKDLCAKSNISCCSACSSLLARVTRERNTETLNLLLLLLFFIENLIQSLVSFERKGKQDEDHDKRWSMEEHGG